MVVGEKENCFTFDYWYIYTASISLFRVSMSTLADAQALMCTNRRWSRLPVDIAKQNREPKFIHPTARMIKQLDFGHRGCGGGRLTFLTARHKRVIAQGRTGVPTIYHSSVVVYGEDPAMFYAFQALLAIEIVSKSRAIEEADYSLDV